MNEKAEVIEPAGLRWSAGAPIPFVVASEQKCLLAFYGPDNEDEHVRVVEFVNCRSVKFGFPNDEVLSGHPLWGHGLKPYAAHEILGSRWLAAVRDNESVHPQATKPVPYPATRHFLLTFHDSTVEALADDMIVRPDRHSSIAAAGVALAAEIGADYPPTPGNVS